MKRWFKKMMSNKYFRVAFACALIMITSAFLYLCLLLSVGRRMPAELLFVLKDIFGGFIAVLNSIVIIAVVIMLVRIMIYGEEVEHDRAYWKGALPDQGIQTEDIKKDSYLLEKHHNNPIPGFVVGMFTYISVPVIIVTQYLHFTLSSFSHMMFFILAEYILIVAIVIIIRICRRFWAFQVRIYSKYPEER